MPDLEPIPDSALKRLGGELAQLLDDDQWNNTEKRYLLPALEEQKDAEALLADARECRDYYKHRAEAAEAEVARLKDAVEGERRMKQVYRDRVTELEAEVARLREELGQHCNVQLVNANARLTNKIAEVDLQSVLAYDAGKREATEAALRWAWDWIYETEHGKEGFIQRGLKALLGNNETNTNNQGEINA